MSSDIPRLRQPSSTPIRGGAVAPSPREVLPQINPTLYDKKNGHSYTAGSCFRNTVDMYVDTFHRHYIIKICTLASQSVSPGSAAVFVVGIARLESSGTAADLIRLLTLLLVLHSALRCNLFSPHDGTLEMATTSICIGSKSKFSTQNGTYIPCTGVGTEGTFTTWKVFHPRHTCHSHSRGDERVSLRLFDVVISKSARYWENKTNQASAASPR